MLSNTPFFSSQMAYLEWIRSMPAISSVEVTDNGTIHEEWVEETDGPYWVAPKSEWLILRVRLLFYVVHRVLRIEEANFSWYVAHQRSEGEKVYAAYLWDTRTRPSRIICAPTLRRARGALDKYLSTSRVSRTTQQLFP